MQPDLCLYCGDTLVMSVNYESNQIKIYNDILLPFTLKRKLKAYPNGLTQMLDMQDLFQQFATFNYFLSHRVLSLSRRNAKKILNLLHASQSQDDATKAKIAISCRGVSVEDNYWVKFATDKAVWANINIRENSLNRAISQVALHGSSLTMHGELNTPELTTHGAYAKCWKRVDGGLWLYKAGDTGDKESKVEIEVSRLLDKTNVPHVKYEEGYSQDILCCRCLCMCNNQLSRLQAMDFYSYMNVLGLNPLNEALKIDSQTIYQMCVVDYLISNRDRHGGNWGFYYDANTTKVLRCHPLFDHNNAFDRDDMKDSNGGDSLIFDGKSKKEVALYALKKCDFRFTEKPKPKDFYYKEHYSSFMQRAKELKLL